LRDRVFRSDALAIDLSSPNTGSRVDPYNPASEMSTAHSDTHGGSDALRHVAKRVRAARVSRGISLETLGRLIGIKLQQISRYETGQCSLSTPRLAAIAEALDTPISYFFEGFGSTEETQLAESHRGTGRLSLLSAYSKLDRERRMVLISIAKSLAESAPGDHRNAAE
jgi:transcriptional regulator with XRE-family HTH domain